MEEKVEAKTQINPEKKSKTRMLLVLLFLVVVAIIGYIALRGQYLELLEIGENYTSVFWQNLTYKSVAFVISFVILFIIIYLTNKGIKKELKPFFDAEKRQVPKLLNKSLALVVSIIGSAIIMNVFTENAMLFVNSTQFGIGDPIFSLDIGYFIFQKPFIEMILMLLISITICVLIYSVIYYIVTFNVCFDGIDRNTLKQSNLVNKIFKYIKSKQWWDTIDGLDRIVGNIAFKDERINDLMLKWSKDEDFWVRRIAIDHQLCRKEKTNTELLEKIIVNNFGSNEFFINKAIGWSLRDYSKTNPKWVKEFVGKYKDKMDKLSIKEASKYI